MKMKLENIAKQALFSINSAWPETVEIQSFSSSFSLFDFEDEDEDENEDENKKARFRPDIK